MWVREMKMKKNWWWWFFFVDTFNAEHIIHVYVFITSCSKNNSDTPLHLLCVCVSFVTAVNYFPFLLGYQNKRNGPESANWILSFFMLPNGEIYGNRFLFISRLFLALFFVPGCWRRLQEEEKVTAVLCGVFCAVFSSSVKEMAILCQFVLSNFPFKITPLIS